MVVSYKRKESSRLRANCFLLELTPSWKAFYAEGSKRQSKFSLFVKTAEKNSGVPIHLKRFPPACILIDNYFLVTMVTGT